LENKTGGDGLTTIPAAFQREKARMLAALNRVVSEWFGDILIEVPSEEILFY